MIVYKLYLSCPVYIFVHILYKCGFRMLRSETVHHEQMHRTWVWCQCISWGSDGCLITWGDPRRGGDSSCVQKQLSELNNLQPKKSSNFDSTLTSVVFFVDLTWTALCSSSRFAVLSYWNLMSHVLQGLEMAFCCRHWCGYKSAQHPKGEANAWISETMGWKWDKG